MIERLSNKIVSYLIAFETIPEAERELYQYGVFLLISQILYFIVTLILGFALGIVFESIIFFVAFQSIRQIAGGYHASTETRCEILSTLAVLLSLIIIKLVNENLLLTHMILISSVFAVVIFFLAPLDTVERLLSTEEFFAFRKKMRIILLVIIVLIIVSYLIKINTLFTPCCMSIVLEGVLLLIGKIKKANIKT